MLRFRWIGYPFSLLLFLSFGLGSCSKGQEAPGWHSLAADFSQDPQGASLSFEQEILPEEWTLYNESKNMWRVPLPHWGAYRKIGGIGLEVFLGASKLEEIEFGESEAQTTSNSADKFFERGGNLVVQLSSGPPTLPLLIKAGLERYSVVDDGTRAFVRNETADGFSVWPGESLALNADLPPDSVLRFSIVAEGLEAAATLEFVVSINAEPIFQFEQALKPGELIRIPQCVALPSEGVLDARIEFAVNGGAASTAFFHPVVGPAKIGSPSARPWSDARPNIIVFLADTFRADNLESWGGDPGLAPVLNGLAQRSKRFLNARSTSIWTLPSHASLFTGLYPPQHGAVNPSLTLPEALTTIAEHLKAHGYRTGAITDSGFVSRQYGMDQGFESFSENDFGPFSLSRTLKSASDFLDSDDGRPVFLFVHTYRTHMPYRQGVEESTTVRDELMERVAAALVNRAGQEEPVKIMGEFAEEYQRLYQLGVKALDQQLDPWLQELEERGVLENGLLVFTSDHGEEFFEHGHRGHRGMPEEEKVLIPLFLFGDGIEPGAVPYDASLIDLAPTIADFCGLPMLDVWEGRSLLSLNQFRLLFTHNAEGNEPFVSAKDRNHKIIALADAERLTQGELRAAFDLNSDPGEQDNLAASATWPSALTRSLAPLWQRLSVPLTDSEQVKASEQVKEQLRQLGY